MDQTDLWKKPVAEQIRLLELYHKYLTTREQFIEATKEARGTFACSPYEGSLSNLQTTLKATSSHAHNPLNNPHAFIPDHSPLETIANQLTKLRKYQIRIAAMNKAQRECRKLLVYAQEESLKREFGTTDGYDDLSEKLIKQSEIAAEACKKLKME